ncbi:MAG: citrate/2-methylcitrate synthase [Spirochaetes bacterium]|nr:citrate/2-methylcitrate synthase [Spirochaetota bacterium]
MNEETKKITELIRKAVEKARKETSSEPEPGLTKKKLDWPIECTVGPGLEGAIACESSIGYVNGSKGWLIYSGYDIFDLSINSTYEEVSYLLLYGRLPTKKELKAYKDQLIKFRDLPLTMRTLMGFPVEDMNPMAALRLGTEFLRQKVSHRDRNINNADILNIIGSDEDSIPMETLPCGEEHAIYEPKLKKDKLIMEKYILDEAIGYRACHRLIAGLPTIAAAISRIREGKLPIAPHPSLSHAANFLYMMNGVQPTEEEERIMDINLILHADHGMNASTFASMVVASTLSDIYFSIGAGIGALNGTLHGGANERVLQMLEKIGHPDKVEKWYKEAVQKKEKIMGFGHRVYKSLDPRARILAPLAKHLCSRNSQSRQLFQIADKLEKVVVSTLGKEKKIFPNVDYYSGLVYKAMGIRTEMFTPIFAVSRVAGWTARVMEYLQHNRIFRPRAMYIGDFNKKYKPISTRKESCK